MHFVARPSNSAFRLLIVLALVTSMPTTALLAQVPDESVVHFWTAARTTHNLTNLAPSKVRLVATPATNVTNFATFRHEGNVAPVDYVPPSSLTRPYVTSAKEEFELIEAGLKEGVSPYTDRKYRITELPEALRGLTLLRTKMGHKAIVDARYAIVLSSHKPCLVFVAVDERAIDIYKKIGAPSWLEEFSPTGLRIRTDDPIMARAGKAYAVFVRKVAEGRIAFGPYATPPAQTAMYFAFLAE